MKKYLLLIAMMVFISCKNKIVITEDELKPDVFYAEQGLKPYSGKCIIYYTHTDLIKEEFRFKKGRLHGESYSYYRNGNIMWKGSYRDGLMSGKWQKWDDTGNLIMEYHYVKDSLDGPYITMYPNGKVKEKGSYSMNKRIGLWVQVNEEEQRVIVNK